MPSIKRYTTHLAITGIAFAITACSIVRYQPTWQADQEYKLTLLHTNDHHGHFWENSHGEYGMAARKTLIDNIREEVALNDGESLLFSGGDINTGTPESDLQNAEPDFKGMNLIQYDAMALGNHEFDNPLDVLKKQREWAGFPFLSANILEKSTGQPLFDAYKIFNVSDLKIAVVGFTTEDTIKIGNPEHIDELIILPPAEVAKKLIPELKTKADFIVAITHMGHYSDGNYGGNAPGDVTLARTVPGIDVIVGGHSQNPLFEPDQINDTLILQAHEWGKYVGRLDLVIKNGAIQSSEYRLVPVNLTKKVKQADGTSTRVHIATEIDRDPEMVALLTPYQEQGQAELLVKVGDVDTLFVGDRAIVRKQETNLGNLIATAMKEKVNADIGIMNSGGIRDDLPEGTVTYKSVLQVQPFANTIAYVDFNTQEITDYLSAVSSKKAGSGAFAQFSGVSFVLKNGNATDIKVNGTSLNASKTYRLALNNYVANGGDGYPNVTEHSSYTNSGYVDADVLVEYFLQNSSVKGADFAPNGNVVR